MSTALTIIGAAGVAASLVALVIHVMGKKNLKVWGTLLIIFAVVLVIGLTS